ncbi:MAG TPA: hypothetical protein VMZ52_04720, partial [Bryobacteraceae bacterium]|nr:hypothetical protein [Bryobacteraceae bacterium]
MRFAFTLLAAVLLASSGAAESHKTKKIVLVTADGLRWQELFSGIDAALMKEKAAGMDKAGALTGRLWKESAEQRRELLMPFVWTEFARQGMIFGNPQRNSKVQVSNSIRVSYPGYSEILTGRSQDAVIRGNDKIQNPT